MDIISEFNHSRYESRSQNTFNAGDFIESIAAPFINDLKSEIQKAFTIPDHLKGFNCFEPNTIASQEALKGCEIDSIISYYGQPTFIKGTISPALISPTSFKEQLKAYQVFVLKDRLAYENDLEEQVAVAVQKLNSLKRENLLSRFFHI